MKISILDAISPVDGRYRKTCEPLAAYFSEASLMRYRVKVEAAYFVSLYKLGLDCFPSCDKATIAEIEQFANDPASADVDAIKQSEQVTNHDVKAVEYYLRTKFDKLNSATEFIHFGLTSQDINNTAIPLLLKDAMNHVMIPQLMELRKKLFNLAEMWRMIPMLAHTHGQPASPTALGKEIAVFVSRIDGQLSMLNTIPWTAKFGGATGNFNAHYISYPDVNWEVFGNKFLESMGLVRNQLTTQIEPYDHLAALFDNIRRINTILIDFCRDMWTYISMNYFSQQVKKGEVGSSAMPHKVNPIDFENAEGNLGMANAIFSHLSEKLPISRLQRDLTDSTVLRNAGVPFAHTLIALKSLIRGLDKIKVNETAIQSDLENNWAVVAEAIQTILRREGYPNPYEALKLLTRTGEKINKETLISFIDKLDISPAVREELKSISPFTFTGNATRFKLS